MRLEPRDLDNAVKAGLISKEQANKLWSYWQKENADVPSFRFTHVMYYFGGFLAISAVTLFFTTAWESLLGLPLFILSTLLFVLGLLLTRFCLDKQLRIPAGIMATFSLVVVPLAIYNLQAWLGYLPKENLSYSDFHYWVNWYWVPMELATLLAGVIMLYFYRFPFLLFPISVTLWYMSMDLIPLMFNLPDFTFTQRATFSMLFGLLILLIALYMDFQYSDEREDYAFWLYIFGVMTFWGGLSCQESTNELGRFLYCLINVFMILVSVFLNRRVFAVFGAIGILGYLGHLSYSVFKDSLAFPLVLVFLGLLIIFAGAKWSRIENKLTEYFRPYMPKAILKRRQY